MLPVVGVLTIVAFIMVERRADEPIIPLRLFGNCTISLVTAISLLAGIGDARHVLLLRALYADDHRPVAGGSRLPVPARVGDLAGDLDARRPDHRGDRPLQMAAGRSDGASAPC